MIPVFRIIIVVINTRIADIITVLFILVNFNFELFV